MGMIMVRVVLMNSLRNKESILRVTGPPMLSVLSGLDEAREASETL